MTGWRGPVGDFLMAPAFGWMWCVAKLMGAEFWIEESDEPMREGDDEQQKRGPQ